MGLQNLKKYDNSWTGIYGVGWRLDNSSI